MLAKFTAWFTWKSVFEFSETSSINCLFCNNFISIFSNKSILNNKYIYFKFLS